MTAIWVLSGIVTLLTIVSIVMWIVNGTQTFSGLERIIHNMGRSYEEISMCKDARIVELEESMLGYERMRVDIREKITIITHLETRNSEKDEELAQYVVDMDRLQTDNVLMERKLATLKKSLGNTP